MCGWRRTAWQPSAPWRRWCRSRRYRTGQTPRCAQRAETGVSNARARKCGRQAAWRGAAGARSSRPFELGLRPGSWPRAGWRNVLRQRTTTMLQSVAVLAGGSGGGGSAPNLLLLLLSQASRRAGLGAVAVHSARRADGFQARRGATGLGERRRLWGFVRATYVRWLCQGVARAAGGTACHARPLSGRAARPARAAECRQRGAAASRVARDISGVRVLLCVSHAGAMLHETLLALMGCTGDIFVDAPPECAPAAPRARRRARRPRNRVTLTRATVQARAAGRRRGGGRGPAGGAAHRGGC